MFAFSLLLYFIHLILTTRPAASSSQISQPVVNTSSGVISGFTQSIQLRNASVVLVDTFLGVPFAQPPIGALRFRSPVPVAFWDGVRNATQWPNTCWQAIDTSFGQIWGTLYSNTYPDMCFELVYLEDKDHLLVSSFIALT